MGGDGGSIPKRADVVKTKGYGFKRNLGGMGYMPNAQVKLTNEENSTKLKMHERWTKCYLTNVSLSFHCTFFTKLVLCFLWHSQHI